MTQAPVPLEAPWEQTLREGFPGWLLPASARTSLDPELARRFLTRLSGRRDHLELLRATSLLQARAELIERFVEVDLPALLRVLPARTVVEQRTWEGGFQGRLDIRATWQLHQAGQPTRFVTRSRRRDLALPENLLVKRVCVRLAQALGTVLATSREHSHWLGPLALQARRLRELLLRTSLREVPDVPRLERHHRQAALAAKHPAYATATALEEALRHGLDSQDPVEVARLLAEGALWPLEAEQRFELAVLVRLVERISQRLRIGEEGSLWCVEHALIIGGRDEVVTFRRGDGATLGLWYNTAPKELEPGRRHKVVGHYLSASRQRPDICLRRQLPGEAARWAVVEIKHTASPQYMAVGIGEALLYELEYGDQLGGWPRAVVVVPGHVEAEAMREDTVVLEGWTRWVSRGVLEGLVGGLV